MLDQSNLGPAIELEILRVRHSETTKIKDAVATEVALTLMVNDIEIVTLLCSPAHLQELAYGYLLVSGFIRTAADVLTCACDYTRQMVHISLAHAPHEHLLAAKMFTSGCGKGVVYTSLAETAPLQAKWAIDKARIGELSRWLQQGSPLYRTTGALHTAALSFQGLTPELCFDDIGRHNAVDKLIGRGLMEGIDFTQMVLLSSGRISSEVLHKAKKCEIAMIVSRGAPTHQAVLLARSMGITVIGFARGIGFSIYSHEERVK